MIVEFGPGVGDFTYEILKRMRSDAVLVAFETNAEFVRFLAASVKDRRFSVVRQSAAEVRHFFAQRCCTGADYVLSGIPFSTLAETERRAILQATRSVLNPGGAMLVYQFSRLVRPDLQHVFGNVNEEFEWLNVFPARVFHCRI